MKQGASGSNQTGSNNFQFVAGLFDLNLKRKFAAGMLDRERLHVALVRMHNFESHRTGQQTGSADGNGSQDADRSVTFVGNKGTGCHVTGRARWRDQSHFWNHLGTHIAQTHALAGKDANLFETAFEFLVGVEYGRRYSSPSRMK